MGLHITQIAPDFTADTTEGPISFHEWIGDKWVILFSHPKDFTPVCTTELGTAAKLKPEFEKRNAKMIAVSVDGVVDHKKWIGDIEETQGCTMNFPIIGDETRKVSRLYDMLTSDAPDTFTVRSVYFIDPNKKIRAIITYPASTGRNFHEILRVIDSLQLTDNYKVATPANWTDGDDVVIVPAIQDPAELATRFPKGFKVVRPWLRMTPQPNK